MKDDIEYEAVTEREWKDLATTEITHLSDEEKDYLPRAWDEWLARVKRDAAREALDGLAEAMQDTPGIGPGTKSHRARMRTDIRIYRSRNYPEETP